MTQQTINNGETGLVVRDKINANFTELYGLPAASLTVDQVSALQGVSGTQPDTASYIHVLLDAADHVLMWVDPLGNLGGRFISNAEVVTARGSLASLGARISSHLTAQGMPLTMWAGSQYLRETRQRITKRRLAESAQLVIGCLGDSWTHGRTRWTEPLAAQLKATYGDAGPGWVGFANNGGTLPNDNVSSSVTVTRTGSWDYTAYYSTAGADLGSAQSTTSGDRLAVAVPATLGATVSLHYIGSTGSVRHSIDGGTTWVGTTALTGTGTQVVALGGIPTTAHSLVIEVVSGPVQLCGMDIKSTAAGVRVHKLGATGSTAAQWAAVDQSAALQALGLNLVFVLLGTNDQGAARTPAQFFTDMTTLLARIRAALPYADICIVMPAENQRVANAYPMTAYAAEAEKIVLANSATYINLQFSFGLNAADYAFGSPRPWFAADLIHPDPTTGGRAILAALQRLIEVQ